MDTVFQVGWAPGPSRLTRTPGFSDQNVNRIVSAEYTIGCLDLVEILLGIRLALLASSPPMSMLESEYLSVVFFVLAAEDGTLAPNALRRLLCVDFDNPQMYDAGKLKVVLSCYGSESEPGTCLVHSR